ncbi:MAG TPA: VOC family protein [Longimicrobiaceae bacterium]|nr:VOC family protein [Longimicrobiaceae bacterium]
MRIDPYLNFDGDCAEAFRFYEQLLGGEIDTMMTHGESPIANEVPPEWHPRILHASLRLGDALLMASDAPPDRYQPPQGNYVSLLVEEPREAERIFHALAEGGRVTMPFEKTFWASGGFGMVTDRFGTPWMINCEGSS